MRAVGVNSLVLFAAAQGLRLKIDCSLFINIYIGEPPGGKKKDYIRLYPHRQCFVLNFQLSE